jgi:hypothetical protein
MFRLAGYEREDGIEVRPRGERAQAELAFSGAFLMIHSATFT